MPERAEAAGRGHHEGSPARVAPWGQRFTTAARASRCPLCSPPLASCCQLPPFAERELPALLPVSRWSLKNHINQNDGWWKASAKSFLWAEGADELFEVWEKLPSRPALCRASPRVFIRSAQGRLTPPHFHCLPRPVPQCPRVCAGLTGARAAPAPPHSAHLLHLCHQEGELGKPYLHQYLPRSCDEMILSAVVRRDGMCGSLVSHCSSSAVSQTRDDQGGLLSEFSHLGVCTSVCEKRENRNFHFAKFHFFRF